MTHEPLAVNLRPFCLGATVEAVMAYEFSELGVSFDGYVATVEIQRPAAQLLRLPTHRTDGGGL